MNVTYINQVIINNQNNNNNSMEQLNILYNIIKGTCKIKFQNFYGSGFLMKTKKGYNDFFCVVTNEHVITKQMVNSKKSIQISYENETKKLKIKLDRSLRFIMDYRYMNIDAIIIQILPMDNIPVECFLNPNLNYKNGYDIFIGKNIFIPQFPGGYNLKGSEGIIKEINKYSNNFIHLASTDNGSSGSPIFLKDSSLIIGIHKGGFINKEENLGEFIGPIIDSLEKDADYIIRMYNEGIYEGEIKDNIREGYGKLIDNNGFSYIGQWYNDKKQGYGVEYFKEQNNQVNINKRIVYEGQFFDNAYNGYGKYIWENMNYYEGEFVNGLCNGKGTLYSSDGTITYEGYFFNNKKQGFGIFNYGNGIYYKGQWFCDLENGEGELYENNILLFKGYFKDGKKNMFGTEYYSNGNIKYWGWFIDNIKNGDGKEYFENGSIKYDGGFMNGQKNGKGSEFYENGNAKYCGDFLYGEKNGFGIECYENGNKKYEGSFTNNMYEGEGTLYYMEINEGINFNFFNTINAYKINIINDKKGILYEGFWKYGKRNGNGTEYYNNGELKFAGTFLNDNYHGYGQLFWISDGNRFSYLGYFKDGKKHGEGKINGSQSSLSILFSSIPFFDNEKSIIKEYKGNFENDKKEGFGTCTYINGDKYVGNWKNDLFDGEGEYYINNLIFYEGKFVKGKKCGEGKEYYIEGPKLGEKKYDGSFSNDLYNGYGEYYYQDGECYKGFWNNGLKHGEGSFINKKGEVVIEGEFKNGNAPFGASVVKNIFTLIKCDGKSYIKDKIFN